MLRVGYRMRGTARFVVGKDFLAVKANVALDGHTMALFPVAFLLVFRNGMSFNRSFPAPHSVTAQAVTLHARSCTLPLMHALTHARSHSVRLSHISSPHSSLHNSSPHTAAGTV